MSACEATSGCYELYSIGSAKFLREIFNSVAMITGSGDFLGACVVAIMLGVILAVIKGIMTGGGKIEVGAIVVSSLVTCIMFVPRATVVVEDVYNGSTYAVDNVPIGVAAPGMFISRVGFTIAELMDQGFSTVDTNFGITNRPFLESTKILSNLRNPQFANSVWDQLGKHTNSDVKRSFYNFFKECTMLKYNFDKTKSVDQDQKMTLENLMDDFQSNVFYTEIYVDGKAVTKTCNDANAILKSKINQLNGDLVNNAMPAPKEYGSNTATEMTDAISMLRLTSADAMEMVKLSIVQPVYDKALAGYFDNSGDVVAALTINNAIQQRNAQWSMEQSLFLNTVRPIITFFEGFVYAVTPFMAILICMGAFGLGIAIKYFQTLIWIQLWMPILAIINLYIYMSAQGAVDSAGIVDKHIDSFYALGTLAQTVETWTSVGGMLAAMTPVIAFFIVAGSAYTFTSIASKLNGADHIDEKAMSPDVLKQAPMMTNTAGSYYSKNQGVGYSDTENQMPTLEFTSADSKATQSSVNASKATTARISKQVAQNAVHQLMSGHDFGSMNTLVDAIKSNGSASLQQALGQIDLSQFSTASEVVNALNRVISGNDTQTKVNSTADTTQNNLAINGSGGGGRTGSKNGNTANVNMVLSGNSNATINENNSEQNGRTIETGTGQNNSEQLKSGNNTSKSDSVNETNSSVKTFGNDLTDALSSYYQEHGGISDNTGISATDAKAFDEAWNDIQQYSNSAELRVGSNWKQAVPLQALAQDISKTEEGSSRIAKLYNGFNDSQRKQVAALSNLYMDKFGVSDPNQAKTMAVLQTAYQGSEANRTEVFDQFNDYYNGGNRNTPNNIKPSDQSGLSGQSTVIGKPIAEEADAKRNAISVKAEEGAENSKNNYKTQKGKVGDKLQQAFLATTQLPEVKKYLEKLDNQSGNDILKSVATTQYLRDEKGNITGLKIGGTEYNLQGLEKEGDFRHKIMKYVWEKLGYEKENADLAYQSASSVEATSQFRGNFDKSVLDIIDTPHGTSDEQIKNDPLIQKYAQDHYFDLNNSTDLHNMRYRVQLFNAVYNSYHNGGIGLDYAHKMSGLANVIHLDSNRKNYIEAHTKIDDNNSNLRTKH